MGGSKGGVFRFFVGSLTIPSVTSPISPAFASVASVLCLFVADRYFAILVTIAGQDSVASPTIVRVGTFNLSLFLKEKP